MSDLFKERRKHVRIYRNFILSYSLKNKAGVQHEISQVNNISLGGISFVATTAFEPGSELAIELQTPFLSDKVHLEGAVLQSIDKIPNLIYEIRVQFNQLSEQAKEVLTKIERYSGEDDGAH